MKKGGKILGTLAVLALVFNNTVYATTESTAESEGFPTKYIFIGVAAIVLILLLFLGYKMDTKGDELFAPKISRSSKKVEKKSAKKPEPKESEYEEDAEISYENDSIDNSEEIADEIEYSEDDEESLFSAENDSNDDSEEFSFSSDEGNEEEKSEEDDNEDEEEYTGEEFDTSIIDGIEDEEDITTSNKEEKPTSFDETMVFDNGSTNITSDKLEDEIDSLDNIDDNMEEINIGGDTSDPFIDELKNFEEPESDFEGFSVESSKDDIGDIEESKPSKKYKKVKKEEKVVEEEKNTEIQDSNDFLAQMEATLQKNKEERNARNKSTTTKNKKE
jgi:hypothetical protein